MDDDERAARRKGPGSARPTVRISGAQRAGDLRPGAHEHEDDPTLAARPGDEGSGAPSGNTGGTDGTDGGDEAPFGHEDWGLSEPPMPHWTEAPTGEVPAVLARPGHDDNPWAALPEPTWREDRSDWEQDEPITPSLLGMEGPPGAGRHADDEDEDDADVWALGRSTGGDEEASTARRGPGHGARELDEDDELFSAWMATTQRHEEPEPTPAHGFAGLGDPAGLVWDPDDVAGEKTGILPATGVPHPLGSTRADAEAAALAADLQERGGRRRWRGIGESVAGRNARHSRRGRRGDERAGEGQDAEPGTQDFFARRRPTVPIASPARPRVAPVPPPSGRQRGAPAAAGSGRPEESPGAGRAGRNVPLAVASGVVIGGAALLAFHFGSVPALVVVTALVGVAAMEAYAAFRRGGYHPATLLGLVAVVALSIGAYTKGERAFPLVIVLLVGFAFLWQLVGVDRRADPVRSVASTLLVFCWVGVFGAFAALLLAPSDYPDRHGIAYLLGAAIVGVAYDVGALAVGAWLGRHPLSRVSPGKTWEGAIGGTVAALVFAVAIVPLIHPWTLDRSVVLGVAVAIVCPIGDLCESLVKRQLGLKDMGRILPGHGGVLDRIDGLLFVLPATYYLLHAFHAG